VAQFNTDHVWKDKAAMSVTEHPGPMSVRLKKAPERVKLERLNCDFGKLHPPEGDQRAWIERLQCALGTTSTAFLDTALIQLQAAARLPNSGVSELGINAALALIENEQPKGETQCAIAVQMACLHLATLAVLGRLGGGHGSDRHVLAVATAASRLSRTFSILVETLRRQRHGGDQSIRVEHVHVHEGGQAIVGAVTRGGG
jgi:hypothetical protein